jgi:hypothetical protein
MLTTTNVMIRIVLAMAGFAAAIIPVRAQSLPMPLFSAANITLGETLRVNIVNLGDPTVPPGPCDLEVTFFNALGQTVKTSNVSVNVGQIGGATVNFLEASQADATVAAGSSLRQVLRPVISVIPPGPCRVVMSLEVYESTSGRTQQYIPPIYIPAAQATTTSSAN